MGLAFLPWEKLPSWLLGPLMAAVGVSFVLHAEPFSWGQWEAVAFIVIGVGMFTLRRKLVEKAYVGEFAPVANLSNA